ncbi:gamma-glutamyltransferase [Paenibacillus hamazuiensis]|uniref:gamma-glutamyltransferase n=1 Tax=Paenibacillus hamazuiensis TaxID=2936508 RepID=UPI00200BCC6C|nr:gamma-glutamyltransferase [Paenibacillus hamazuiensis]
MEKAMSGASVMVVSPHALASAAGARILERGGNAFDAAVAVSACLAVVYPHMTGVGGDSFWLMYHSQERAVRAYNGSGRSGYGAAIELFAGEASIPVRGIRSIVTVPGMVDSWDAVLREYGRMRLADVLEPAIAYAEGGFPLSPDQHKDTRLRRDVLAAEPSTARIYLPARKVPEAGARFVQKELAQTLRQIALKGRDEFYKGELAGRIVSFLGERNGLLAAEDFADHAGSWVTPAAGSYRGLDLYQLPPNSQGFTAIMAAQIIENCDFGGVEHGSYEYYHLLIEALKLSFRDRNRTLTDPEFADIPLASFLDKSYCRQLYSQIAMDRALTLEPERLGSDTAYAAVVDKDGNAVSFIQSLYFEFGSGVVAGDTGILLQNRGSYFSLDPGHVNRLEPRKRTFHTLMPAMALREGKPYLLYGTQGGEGQPQTQTALLTRMVDYGMDPQTAINEPRWVWGRTWGDESQELRLESRIGEKVAARLAQAGHKVRMVGDYDGVVGHAQAILIDESGFRIGGSDPRCDGAAIGW